MEISISTTLLLTVSCCLWTTEGQLFPFPPLNQEDLVHWDGRKTILRLSIPNGGQLGTWDVIKYCHKGFARGFQLKVSSYQIDKKGRDNTGLDGIALYCDDGSSISSSMILWGTWTTIQNCPKGFLVSFSLRVQPPQGRGDNTAANNIQFKCSDGSTLMGTGTMGGQFGRWSPTCPHGSYICGMQTRIQGYQWWGDDTSLNDVKFFCCVN